MAFSNSRLSNFEVIRVGYTRAAIRELDTADATQKIPFFFSPFGGGVGGGAAQKWQGNFGVARAEWNGARPRRIQTPMRTLHVRITTRSARCNHGLSSKWVRAKVNMSAQIETSSELRREGRRAEGAAESKRARRVATKCDGAGAEKRADLSLFRIRIIFSKL